MEDPRKLEEGFGNGAQPASKDEDFQGKKTTENIVCDAISNENEQKSITTSDLPEERREEEPLIKQKTKRIATLDAFRGLTIVLMVLVDDAGGAYPRIDHSPWNGCTLADFVMPFFLFIVGVAIALALKKIPKVEYAIRKITLRTLKLLFWGILLQGGYSHAPDDLSYGVDMKKIRWCGILQRIALVYFVVALIETLTTKLRPSSLSPGHFSIFTAYKWQWIGGFAAFVIYMVTTFSLYVPDWSFVVYDDHKHDRYTVKCGMRGHLGPACNAVGYVDRQVWGINHLYNQPVWARLRACTLSSPAAGPLREDAPTWCQAPFEPEGLLSSISAIISGTIGIHYGHVLIHFKGHAERLKQWVSGTGFTNSSRNSSLHRCHSHQQAALQFQLCLLHCRCSWHCILRFLHDGMNAMLVFVMAAQGIFAAFINGWYFKDPDNNLVNWIQKHVFIDVWKSERVGTLLYVLFAEITFWAVVSGILHKLGIYWKL
ncbi:UNVERIFIED_CONTAM: Heparan-alpha-glucosaminide N-acetyltransferase [Sesamum latifolium]|uniref:Heparan-alpha-glucosaminide N-acetyltransferase n=1 Tax=Sesamum latifolium TaxID=2727402 RepID=A0AAW2U2T8_9LAMI